MPSLWQKCFTGSERDFSTPTPCVTVFCDEGKMCLSAHASVLSGQCVTGGGGAGKHSGGSSHWSTYSSRAMRSAGLDFPLSEDIHGMRTGWNCFQTHHQQCLISSNTRPATPALPDIPQKPYCRYRELKGQVIQSDAKGATVFGEQTRQYIWRMGSVLNCASPLHGVMMGNKKIFLL